ncbi:helix-turn-helix domain-containing protein [Halalkalirubrum salinum]|uniref:helix-turn-helix domain-containing protein n=1 Tax=Halalkalirubrum salinum TaxID=2563889 RepID=UPI0010FB4281|nr:helix-turn-helix domain-containing protein [Halalkalirubrum salinum]
MYSEAELRALATIEDEPTVSDLADNLERSLSYTSELVTRMESKGLIHTSSKGKTKRIQRSDAHAIELYDRFVHRYTHIPFPELLSGATLKILYNLDSPASATELAEQADVHLSTVHRSLSPLENRGIVYKINGEYALNGEFEDLSVLAQSFSHLRNRERVDDQVTSYTILWESLDEVLVQTDEEIDDKRFHLTGPERFQDYGLPLLARQRRYYLYSESASEISPVELCCHMLVIDDGTRSQSYCLLLLHEVSFDRETLLTTAERYDVKEIVKNLLAYLDSEGEERSGSLPRWTEFRDLADEYGVTV